VYWLTVLLGILLVTACAVTGSVLLLFRARRLGAWERGYSVSTPHLPLIATAIGALAGIVIGVLILYFAQDSARFNLIEWIGRGSYFLVAGASGGHLLILLRTGLHLIREEKAWSAGTDRGQGTLSHRRMRQLQSLRRSHKHYIDLKMRDDQVVDELVGVIGTPLMNTRHDLSRIPFYGYLGTVCGILLMAEEIGHINEATETFKVLSSMARGLVLAFQTTLVALLAFLPLRKAADYLIRRVGRLEEAWNRALDEG
jgi:biopolymer transport protein ExbB/TolQ